MTETLVAYDYLEAGLYPGRYEFSLQQSVTHSGKPESGLAQAPLKLVRDRSQILTVGLPAFTLPDPGEIRACYPPPASETACLHELPYVLLERRTLPWEREIGKDRRTPWLALLVLSADELQAWAGLSRVKGSTLPAPTATEADKVADVTALDIDAAYFHAICPRHAELPLLAHIRQVSMAAKAGGADQVGEFALVLANRFPQAGENIALLVSLEGHEQRLGDAAPGADERVRLAVLHQWRFAGRADSAGGFETRVAALTAGQLRAPAETSWSDGLQRLLEQGYVPVAQETEAGRRRAAIYRGPLAPLAPASAALTAPALLGPPDLDAQDISAASAWQLGRLLALSSSEFANAVLRAVNQRTADRLGGGRTDLDDHTAVGLLGTLSGILEGQRSRMADPPPAALDALTIGRWLARLIVLAPAPLRYLVPSDRMLPMEAIRSFHVDEAWTFDALAGGSLSLGSELIAPPATLAAPTRGQLRDAIWRLIEEVRRWTPDDGPDKSALPTRKPIHGLLLRTRLLRDYPGLEVIVHDGRGAPVRPLRFETVGEDTVILLVQGPVTQLELREPREGLKFRCSERRVLLARDDDPELGLDGHMRKATAPGVLDVVSLADAIGCGPQRSSARFGARWMNLPSDFKLEWKYAG